MSQHMTLEQCVDSLANWAYTDSRVELDKAVLKDVLRTDYGVTGRYLTEEECEQFICGDDDGEVPGELMELFPQTQEFIASYW